MAPEQMKAAIGQASKAFYQRQSDEKAKACAEHARQRKTSSESVANGHFKREWLPDPLVFFTQYQQMKLRGRGSWRMTHCIFHDDGHASLSVNVETGAYRCHACQAKGGDVLAFYRQLTGASFVDAAQVLGAWEFETYG